MYSKYCHMKNVPTELILMILEYIPYNAYQVKTVNCCQPIPAPLKYFDNHFDGCSLVLVQNMAESTFEL